MESACAWLTFCLRPLLAAFGPLADEVEPLDCGTVEGDMERAGIVGGGPGSPAGDLLCIDRCEGRGACMVRPAFFSGEDSGRISADHYFGAQVK